MENDTLFFVQLGSILAYIGMYIAGFIYIYKVLIKQKDSIIQLKDSHIEFLKEQNKSLKENAPDILLERFKNKLEYFKQELEHADKEKQEIIDKKENEIKKILGDIEDLNEQYKSLKNLAKEYFCPFCNSPLVSKEYHTETHDNIDFDHEWLTYECGLIIADNEEIQKCRFNKLA